MLSARDQLADPVSTPRYGRPPAAARRPMRRHAVRPSRRHDRPPPGGALEQAGPAVKQNRCTRTTRAWREAAPARRAPPALALPLCRKLALTAVEGWQQRREPQCDSGCAEQIAHL